MEQERIFSADQIKVHPDLAKIIREYTKAAIKTDPEDLLEFSWNYFKKKVDEEQVCSMQYAVCSMQYAVCSMQYAVCALVRYVNGATRLHVYGVSLPLCLTVSLSHCLSASTPLRLGRRVSYRRGRMRRRRGKKIR
jgi:hypothetical protein